MLKCHPSNFTPSYSKTQEAEAERENLVVTPTIEVEELEDVDNSFKELAAKNESYASLGSGYEGDGESEGDFDVMECELEGKITKIHKLYPTLRMNVASFHILC